MCIRIAIFDDNKHTRNTVTLLLKSDPSLEIVGTFSSTEKCISEVYRLKPDIVIMDIEIEKVATTETVRLLTRKFPQVRILIQTVFQDDERVVQFISAGASGYILKNHMTRFLISAVKELYNGGAPMSPAIARKVINILQRGHGGRAELPNEPSTLTPREMEVLAGVVEGLSHKMIGYKLNISYHTVRTHIKNIYEKLDVSSLTGVVAKAIQHKII